MIDIKDLSDNIEKIDLTEFKEIVKELQEEKLQEEYDGKVPEYYTEEQEC